MTVYNRAYRDFGGSLTADWQRPLVITRFALEELFQSKFFLAFFLACFIPSLVMLVAMYLRYNTEAMAQFGVSLSDLFDIDRDFFVVLLQRPAAILAFVMILIVGPALVSPDLRNNAMPLYLSRPVSKTDYIVGKLLVLIIMTSAITWIPGLLLFVMQAYLAEPGWLLDNIRIVPAMVTTSLVWSTSMGMFALAISAAVKWKPVARLTYLALVFVMSMFGTMVREVFGSWTGGLVNVFDAHEALAASLYGVWSYAEMPAAWAPWGVFGVLTLVATRFLLRRIRAFEVVR